ncbi:hypothetical protein D3C75_1209240 [compost metagenome]
MRHQENHVAAFLTDFIQHFFTVPTYALEYFLRFGTGQFRHQDHRLRCGGKHLIDNLFALLFRQFRHAIEQIDTGAASCPFRNLASQFTNRTQ